MTSAGIEFELTRKRVKNINLRIHPPEGRVTVSAPLRTSEAHRGVRRRQSRRHQGSAQPPRPELRYVTGEEHRIGTAHVLEVPSTGRSCRREAAPRRASPRLVVHARDPHDAAEVQRHLERLSRTPAPPRRACPVGTTRRPHHPHPHPCHETQVGACRTRTGVAAEPPRAIEYHELAHPSRRTARAFRPSFGHMPDWRVETPSTAGCDAGVRMQRPNRYVCIANPAFPCGTNPPLNSRRGTPRRGRLRIEAGELQRRLAADTKPASNRSFTFAIVGSLLIASFFLWPYWTTGDMDIWAVLLLAPFAFGPMIAYHGWRRWGLLGVLGALTAM